MQWIIILFAGPSAIWSLVLLHEHFFKEDNNKTEEISLKKEMKKAFKIYIQEHERKIKPTHDINVIKDTCPSLDELLQAEGYINKANGEWEKPPLLSKKEVKGIVGRHNAINKTKGIKPNEKQIYKAISRRTGQNEATVETLYGEYVTQAVKNINEHKENKVFLPNYMLPETVHAVSDFEHMKEAKIIFLAVPAQHIRTVCEGLSAHIKPSSPVIIVAKGIELSSNKLMSEVVSEVLPENPIYILSGPSFASEVASASPSALTLASEHNAETIASVISSPTFRIYTTDDIIGAQIGGALKNVLAIACGIVVGRKFGENAKAALITRGLAEIARLGAVLGARTETLMGLSGIGDIVLTCSSPKSRNMSFGIALGEGKPLQELLAKGNHVTEGIATSRAALGLARRHGVEMPVVSAVDMILRHEASINECINSLLSRPLKHETL